MKVGILKERNDEQRVALLPDGVKALCDKGLEVLVESGAGTAAHCDDARYSAAGALISERTALLGSCGLLLGIQPPEGHELTVPARGTALVCMLDPLANHEIVRRVADAGITAFSLDTVPRTTRAQAMDVLSSMATIAGYKAVLLAAGTLPTFFPMFMTAAGSIAPAKVLILGAGVAGLQAIATARRLGAVVEAFDVRSAVREEVQSLGARFVAVEGAREEEAAGGYAVEQNEEYQQRQRQLIHEHVAKSDVVICTAQIPGRRAPLLVTRQSVEAMKAGSVIVDLAAASGGNCELSRNRETVYHNGVCIIGHSNLPATMPVDASRMFSKNLGNFLNLLVAEGALHLDFEDDIVRGACICHNGEIVNERVKAATA